MNRVFFVSDCVVPIRDGQSVSTVLGVLGCLRNVLPHVSVGEGGEGEMRGSFGVRRCHQEAPLAVDRMIQVVWQAWTKFMWFRIGTRLTGECVKEHLGSVKYGEFLE
jgi:hypothetical protein